MISQSAAVGQSVSTRLAPLLTFCVLAAGTLLVWRQQAVRDRELIVSRSQDVASQSSQRLATLVDSGLTAATIFARRWSTHEKRDFSQRRFRDFASVLVAEIPSIYDLRLIGPKSSINWRARPGVSSGWNRLGHHAAEILTAARAQAGPVLSRPVRMQQDSTHFFAALRLQRGAEFLGILAVEFKSDKLIDDGFNDRIRSEFSFQVSDGDDPIYSYGPEGVSAQARSLSAEQEVAILNRTWTFAARPRDSTLAKIGWRASISIPVFGLILSGGLSGLLYLVLRRMQLYRRERNRALREVAERKKTQQELRASEARYRSVFASATDGLLVVDDDDRIVEANPVACQMHGYPPGQLNGTSVLDLICADYRHLYIRFKAQPEQQQGVRLDSVHQRVDGSRFDVEVRANRFRRGEQERVLVIVTDLTERHRTVQRLASLSRKIMLAQEEERARVSRELHDELGQLLTAAQLELGWLQKNAASEKESLRDATGQSIRLVEQAADELRRICRGLRPPVLDDIGLEPAAIQLVREFEDRSPTSVQLALDLDDEIPLRAETALCVYRVLQESLNNISRHAEASKVSISLASNSGGALLVVRDNGVGFDPAQVNGSRGCGLEGMQERANLANGQLDIQSQPGQGTMIRLRVPGPQGMRCP